jgi:hypothetical protein
MCEVYGAREVLFALGDLFGEYILGTRTREALPQQLASLSAAARDLTAAAMRLAPKK